MIPLNNTGGGASGPTAGGLRYPRERIGSDTDWVLFNFYKYSAPFRDQANSSITNTATLTNYNSSSGNTLGSSIGTIQMYMPEDIEAQYGANWQDTNLSNMARGALGAFGSAANANIGEAIGKTIDTIYTGTENFLTKGTGVANAISQILNQANFGSLTVNDVFSASTGQILNPNTEVLYKGPKMRNFSLSFKMAPRNLTEATDIKNIITQFKKSTLPKFGGVGGGAGKADPSASFVAVPDIVDVTFMRGSSPSEWVTQFKPCVITDFSVSYTPDGAWARLPDGSPVATTMKISFQETKMVYSDEISQSGPSF